jgi:hypothetical protein
MIHFGLDPGKFVRFLSGKYTGQYWDVCHTLNAIQDHVTSEDYGRIKQILLDGCPAQLTFKEPLSNKLEFISRGNSKSFVKNPQLVQKMMNKEDRYSHLVPMDPLLCKLSPYLHHTMQSIVIKDGKNNHIVWDKLTVTRLTDIVMNQVTPVAKEAPVTFGRQKPDLHGHLQHVDQLSNCNNSSWSSRCQGMFQIPKNPHRFNWSIRFHSRQIV